MTGSSVRAEAYRRDAFTVMYKAGRDPDLASARKTEFVTLASGVSDTPDNTGGTQDPSDGSGTEDGSFSDLLRQLAHAPPPDVENPLRLDPGTVLDGKLEIESVLGRGGMGVVYLAQHLTLSRQVALKLTLAGGTPMATARLLREARATASITHENVVTVYDVGTIDEQVFIAMEYLDGGTLKNWLEAGERSWPEIQALMVSAGGGLAAAHARGLVHRDFKPDNVLLGKDGRVRVADFGLARAASPEASQQDTLKPATDTGDSVRLSRLTETGTTAGTPAYMAPEQLAGVNADERSDQFAFCVSMFEALYGGRPFLARTVAELYDKITNEEIVTTKANPAVPAHVRRAIFRGLKASPSDRFDSMQAVIKELSRDPAARLRRRAATVLAAGGIAGATWLAASGGSQDDPCATNEESLAGIWDEPTREKLAASFAAVGTDAEAASEVARGLLDAYAEAWTSASRDACEAAVVHKTQSQEMLVLRTSCLQHARRALAATVNVLANANASVVTHAHDAAAKLPALEHCQDVEALGRVTAVPRDKAEAATTIRRALAEATANVRAGNRIKGRKLAEAALPEAEALEVNVVLGEALDALSLSEAKVSDWAAASEHALAAIAASSRAQDDTRLAELASRMHYITGVQVGSPMAETWASLADAWIDRIGSPSEARSAYYVTSGLVATRHGRYAEALEEFESASALLEDPEGIGALAVRGAIAEALRKRGDLKAARSHVEDTIRIARKALGPGHPVLAQELDRAGAIAMRLGEFATAKDYLRRAVAIRKATMGEENPLVAATLHNLGQTMLLSGDPSGAVEVLRRAQDLIGPEGRVRDKAALLMTLTGALRELGETEEALALQTRALELTEESFGPEDPNTVGQRYNLAAVEKDLGHVEVAMAQVQRAHRDFTKSNNENKLLGALILALRGALYLRREETEAALQDSIAALEILSETDANDFPYTLEPLIVAGEASMLLGRIEDARRYGEQALVDGGEKIEAETNARIVALVKGSKPQRYEP